MQIKTYLTYLSLLLIFLAPSATAISVSVAQGGGGAGSSGLSMGYNLDQFTGLSENIAIGEGAIFSSRYVEGAGNNSISQIGSNRNAILSSDVASSGTLSSSGSAYASGEAVGLSQNVHATGISEAGVAGSTGLKGTAQESAALDGFMESSQAVSSQKESLGASQSSNIVAAVGYINGKARSDENEIKITGGLNGPGAVSSAMDSYATDGDGAMASGVVKTASLKSKAYSAAKATSAEADAFSYLSSDDRLTSSISASASGHVDASQEIDAKGKSLIYASTNHDGSSKDYSVTSGKSVAGKLSVNAGSPQVIKPELDGDVVDSVNGLTAMPGSWVWSDLSGMMSSNPFAIRDTLGQRHVFAKGSDNSLYDNLDGDWRGLGGSIASDPYAVNDDKGRVHIFAKGSSGGLVDRMLDSYSLSGSWLTLGTTMAGSPSAALTPGRSNINIAVRDLDNTLWIRSLDTGTLTGSWTNRGGSILSNPYVAYDSAGKMHSLVRYSDNTLRDNVDGTWKSLGGSITSDAKPLVDPAKPGYVFTYARDSDGSLVTNTLNTATGTFAWKDLGGTISAGTSSSIYRGNPAPVLDSSGVTHVFARGTDGALWENANGVWTSRGGSITSDPSAINSDGLLEVAARGSTGKLSLAQPEVFGAWPNPTGNVIGGGSGYKKIIARSKAKYVVSDATGLISALGKAISGDIIYVDDNAQIDMTGKRSVKIPAGVTIASGRGNGGFLGGLIYSNDQGDDITLFSAQQNVRLTGLRLRGPSGSRSTTLSTNGISSSYTGFEVDNNEIFNWPHAGVVVNGGSTDAKVHHNYIHNNQKDCIGYGVVLGSGNAVAKIEGNIFDYNRHHVAGVGTTGNKYEFRYNKVLEHDTITEGLDMHGGVSRGDGTNIAGDLLNIHHNTFGLTKYPAIGISGIPNDGLYVYNNWFARSDPSYTYVQTQATGHVYVYNNQYGL